MRKVLFILSELTDTDLDWMIRNGSKQIVPAGTVIIEEHEPLDVLYVVLEGELSVSLSANKVLAVLRAGEILGELSFLDSRPPSATVTTVEESTLLSIPRARLAAKLAEDEGFAARFYRALAVFLAARLRRSTLQLGYDRERILDEDSQHEDELDPGLLDQIALAGARFDWMLRKLHSVPGEQRPAPRNPEPRAGN